LTENNKKKLVESKNKPQNKQFYIVIPFLEMSVR
jgi:hypothetical protein